MAQTSRRYPFVQLDVFASRAFEGNPLAVVSDGRGLGEQEMQSIARELNLSETTFIFPRDGQIERQRGIRARIFTVQEELPFAGHPTLGTAFCLRGAGKTSEITLDLNVGKVPVRFETAPGQPDFGEMTQIDPTFGPMHDRAAVARALGLLPSDLDSSLPIQTVSTGLPFTIVPLGSLEVAQRLRINLDWASAYLAKSGGSKFFYFVCRQTVDSSARLHARMLFYHGEDPATGSAAGCAAAWMVAHGVAQPDERVLIEQGVAALRPSRIFVSASRRDDRVVNVRVGGNAVEVLRGEIFF